MGPRARIDCASRSVDGWKTRGAPRPTSNIAPAAAAVKVFCPRVISTFFPRSDPEGILPQIGPSDGSCPRGILLQRRTRRTLHQRGSQKGLPEGLCPRGTPRNAPPEGNHRGFLPERNPEERSPRGKPQRVSAREEPRGTLPQRETTEGFCPRGTPR